MIDWQRTDAELASDNHHERGVERGAGWASWEGDARCEVAVVGAGLAGLSAALELAQRGLQVVVLEAARVGGGASGRNGGQVLPGLACDMGTIEAQLGRDEALKVWRACAAAVDRLRERCARHGIDAEWQTGALTVAVGPRKAARLLRDAQHLQDRYQHPLTLIPQAELPAWIRSPRYHAACYDTQAGHVHPLKLSLGLARAAQGLGVRLHERSPVLRIEPGAETRLHTATGCLSARHVVLAGNVYLGRLAPQASARIMPVGTYVGATTRLDPDLLRSLIPSRAAVCDTDVVLDYFRPSADDRLIFGGRVSYSTATPRELAASLHRRMAAVFPPLQRVRFDHVWGGFVDITANRAPDFGRLWREQGASVYYLQGFCGHGLALTGLAGELVAQAVAGDAEGFDRFARLRHHPFPGGAHWRTPLLVLGMAWHRLADLF